MFAFGMFELIIREADTFWLSSAKTLGQRPMLRKTSYDRF